LGWGTKCVFTREKVTKKLEVKVFFKFHPKFLLKYTLHSIFKCKIMFRNFCIDWFKLQFCIVKWKTVLNPLLASEVALSVEFYYVYSSTKNSFWTTFCTRFINFPFFTQIYSKFSFLLEPQNCHFLPKYIQNSHFLPKYIQNSHFLPKYIQNCHFYLSLKWFRRHPTSELFRTAGTIPLFYTTPSNTT